MTRLHRLRRWIARRVDIDGVVLELDQAQQIAVTKLNASEMAKRIPTWL